MSTDTSSSGGAPDNSGGSNQEKENQEKPNTVSHDTYKKAVDEVKSAKARLAAYEAKEREQQEKSGEFQKLYEQLKAENETLKEATKKERATFAYRTVSNQFQAEAAKLGCKKPDALERLVDMSGLTSHVGENYVVDHGELKKFIEQAAKEHDYLFAKDAPGFRDAAPAGKTGEKLTLAQELKTAKNQTEFDAILRKHGM